MNFQTILFDFDGVLCKERFYNGDLQNNYPKVYDWIQSNIFTDGNLTKKWMRGEISSSEVNKIIAENTGIEFEILHQLFLDGIKNMRLNLEVLELAKSLKSSGIKIGIVTDNMDIFSEITVPNHKLDKVFDTIINSSDFGFLKPEENGQLFDFAFRNLSEKIENGLMIDDNLKILELFEKKGGKGFHYKNFAELEEFLQR